MNISSVENMYNGLKISQFTEESLLDYLNHNFYSDEVNEYIITQWLADNGFVEIENTEEWDTKIGK